VSALGQNGSKNFYVDYPPKADVCCATRDVRFGSKKTFALQ
jgi:hypothetical protein